MEKYQSIKIPAPEFDLYESVNRCWEKNIVSKITDRKYSPDREQWEYQLSGQYYYPGNAIERNYSN